MHPNAELVTRFYEAFARRDGAAMAACYHEDVRFSDPVFPDLRGERAGAMWKMLTGRADDLDIQFSGVEADDARGKAQWVARYTFSQTGKKVVNVIDAAFEFRDGKIVRHTDTFDFWKWSSQALGVPGKLFGWSSLLQNAVRKKAAKGLDAFMAKSGS
jgi:ketosteroid isomerase-like protein